jgi:anti-repressor protein
MNELKTFTNAEFGSVRTIEIDNEPYFVGKDVAEILGYSEPRSAVSKKVDSEDRGVAKMETPSGVQEMTTINESGLYSLIFGSKLPKAKEFKHWVTSEVLPSIRKHGMYATNELLNDPDFAIQAFTALKEERERRKQLESIVEQDKPKVLFADAVETAQTSILVGDLAKLIKQNGVDIGQKRLFNYLRENGYLIKSGNSKNMPTQKAMDKGLFEVKERTINNPDGSVRITKTTKVTGKGQTYFINEFLA